MKTIKVLFLLVVCNMATPLFSETPTPAISAIEKNTSRHSFEAGEYTLEWVSAPSAASPKGRTGKGTFIVENTEYGQTLHDNTIWHIDGTEKGSGTVRDIEGIILSDIMGNTHMFTYKKDGGGFYGKIEKQIDGTLLIKGEGLYRSLGGCKIQMETIVTPTNNGYTSLNYFYNSKTKQWTLLRTDILKKVS